MNKNLKDYRFDALTKCPMCGQKAHFFGKRLDRSQGLRPEKIGGFEIKLDKCENCQLVYPNPIPVALNVERYGEGITDELWSRRALVDQENFIFELTILKTLTDQPLKELVALDIGFGLGNSLVTLSASFKEVHGLEPFAGLFNRALTTYSQRINTTLLKQQSLEEANYADKQFDFIFFEAIQHLPDLPGGIQKALTWLKPGGILYVEVPSSAYLFHRMINLVYKIRGTRFVMNTSPMHGNFSYYEFSVKSFVEHGKLNGYSVIRNDVFPCEPPLNRWMKKLFVFVMKLTGTGMQRSIWIQKN